MDPLTYRPAGVDIRAGDGILGLGSSGLHSNGDPRAWPVPPVFGAIQRAAAIDEAEMRRTFDMGLGFLVAVAAAEIRAGARGVLHV